MGYKYYEGKSQRGLKNNLENRIRIIPVAVLFGSKGIILTAKIVGGDYKNPVLTKGIILATKKYY